MEIPFLHTYGCMGGGGYNAANDSKVRDIAKKITQKILGYARIGRFVVRSLEKTYKIY